MKDGKPDGYWKTFYENGGLKSEGNRENFDLDGVWNFYNEEGKITESITYKSAKKDGVRKKYHETGNLKREEYYNQDVRVDRINTYYPSGKIKEFIPIDTLGKGLEHGLGYEYAEVDGRIIALVTYRNGFIAGRERINRKDKFNQKQGIWKWFYEDNKEKEVGRYANDKKHGYFKTFDRDGNLLETLKYQDGILIPDPEELAKLDIKREYFSNAQVKTEGSYNKGVREGVHRSYNMEGKVEAATIYSKGKIIGQGIVDSEGRRQGKWKEFYDSGELRSEGAYVDGQRKGVWVFYYKDGKEEQRGNYHKGKPDGDWKWSYANGQTWREESFYEGLEEGLATEYNDTGKVVSKGNYLDGEKEGEWIIDLGDHREEGAYVAGQKNGVWKHYFPTGKLKFEGKFTQGMEDGKHVFYFENGKMKTVGHFKFGLKEGDWFEYTEDGEEKSIISYKQGEVVKIDGQKVPVLSEDKAQ